MLAPAPRISLWLFLLVAGVLLLAGCTKSEQYVSGQSIYGKYCVTCHQEDGQGIPNAFPPLAGADWIEGDKGRLIRLVISGMQGPITVRGEQYNNVMTPHSFLTDAQIAAVLTYVRSSFGNDAGPVTQAEVAAVREANTHEGFWTPRQLDRELGIPEPDTLAQSRE